MIALVAAIPPPPFSTFHIGPLTIRMYGIMIGLGVLAGVWLAGRLFQERGIGDIDDTASIAVWGVFAGIIGARFYHVVTDFQDFQNGNFIDAFKVWKPGLGIPGGIFFGTLAGIWAARRRGIPVLPALSCAAPAIPLAQAIGRFGNYFNEELYGRPTTLPWGLEVSSAVNTGYPPGTLFQPTFLYEPLWNFALCAALVWVFHHRPRLQPGRLFPLYMIGYGVGRLWIESLRIDPSNKIGPFRTNIWMALLLIVGGATWFIMTRDSTARWPHPLRIGGYTGNDDGDRQEREDHRSSMGAAAAVAAGRRRRANDGERDDDAETDLDRSDAAKTVGAKTGATKADGAKTGATKADVDNTGATKADVDRSGVAKADAAKTDAAEADAAESDAAGNDAGPDVARVDADRGRSREATRTPTADDADTTVGNETAAAAGTGGGFDSDNDEATTDDGTPARRKRGTLAKRSASSSATRAKRGSRSHGTRTRPEPKGADSKASDGVDAQSDAAQSDKAKVDPAKAGAAKRGAANSGAAKAKAAGVGEVDGEASSAADGELAEARRSAELGEEAATDD